MTFGEIKNLVMFQVNNDPEDLEDYLPYVDRYCNDGYDLLTKAWDQSHAYTTEYPALELDSDAPLLPEWTHWGIADYATYLVYRNGNPQKQQRGMQYLARFQELIGRIYMDGGSKGKRDRFINIYP